MDKHQAWFLSLLIASIVPGWHFLFRTFALSWRNEDYTHILLVLPVVAGLLLLDRKNLLDTPEWNFRAGSLIFVIVGAVACGMGLWFASLSGDEITSLGMLVLVLFWIGISVTCFGPRVCHRALFSLLFLFVLVPIPKIALDRVIAFLQIGSTWSTHMFYALADVPVIQQGNKLTIPGLVVNVARECSSIRSSSMLAVTTLVIAHLLLRSPWRKTLIVALVIPLSVAKNGLRIFTITMLGTRVDPGYLTGQLHRQGGILFFIVALAGIFWLIRALQRGERAGKIRPSVAFAEYHSNI